MTADNRIQLKLKLLRFLNATIIPALRHRRAKGMLTSLKNILGKKQDPNKITKDFWDRESGTWQIGKGLHWTELIAIHERLNRKMSGDTYIDLYLYLLKFLTERGLHFPVGRCLTVGCGAGDFERSLSRFRVCDRHDAYDISEGAIEKAWANAREAGLSHIHYEAADINELSLPSDSYDIVFGIQSIHHLANLERVFSEVRKALKPGGFFILHEFVGPSKFQWTDAQLNIINAALQMLPDKYCISRKDGITIKKKHWRPTLQEMDSIDPSEAIRSSDILTVLSMYFDILEKKDLGGSVLHLLLDGIAGNFDYDNPKDMILLRMLFEIEDAFMDIGVIQSDFVFLVAKKKGI